MLPTGVKPARRHQLVVSTLFDDLPLIKREDLFVQELHGSAPRTLVIEIDVSLMTRPDHGAMAGPLVTRFGKILATIARSSDQAFVRIRPQDGHMIPIDRLPGIVKAVASVLLKSRPPFASRFRT